MQVIYISYTSETNKQTTNNPPKNIPNKQQTNKTNQPEKPQTNNNKKRNDTITFGK